MNTEFQLKLVSQWEKYFPQTELPVVFYYADTAPQTEDDVPKGAQHCVIESLQRARQGQTLVFDLEHTHCMGGRRYLGFATELSPTFNYFLSCGIPGKVRGERYKRTPELVAEVVAFQPRFEAPAQYIVFKRWDLLTEAENPEVVIFFAKPDVLSGLFTLANFDRVDAHGVIAPFGAGCSSIVQHPYLEGRTEDPHCVLGMFDVSARPHVSSNELTFATPWKRFEQLVSYMDESFLITPSWDIVKGRLGE